MTAYVERFSLRQRVEHLVGMILFTTLATTGLPQKYADAGWATTLIGWMGGIELTRWFHRTAGILFSIMTAIHVGTAIASVLGGRASLSIRPPRSRTSGTPSRTSATTSGSSIIRPGSTAPAPRPAEV